MTKPKIDPIGITLFIIFFSLLGYCGYLAHLSIDNDVLKKMESQPLVLPTQPPETNLPQSTPVSTTTQSR